MSRIALHLLIAAFCFLCCAHLDAQTNRFAQDRFAIGFWVDPPADDKMEAHYQDIADANFTFALGGFGATTPTNVARQLAYCEKLGLKAIVAMAGLAVDKLPTNNACWVILPRTNRPLERFRICDSNWPRFAPRGLANWGSSIFIPTGFPPTPSA